ncbi:serine/threonine protein kinase, partial [Coemansia erecta]
MAISPEPTMTCPASNTQDRSLAILLPSSKTTRKALSPRLSNKATLVSPHNAGEQCPASALIDGDSSSSAHAVDGTLSLSVRPAGWTHTVFGRSIRRLGAGTGGHVDLHHSPTTNKVVAIKTLQITDESTDSQAAFLSRRALEELGIAANVQHDNIVRTHEIVVEPDRRCFVIMEACTVDLLALLQQRASMQGAYVSKQQLDAYFVQLVRGVCYLHKMGIAHRDLKLDNVCVTEHGVVKIVDFGCATLFRRRVPREAAELRVPCATQGSGTTGYRAPDMPRIGGTAERGVPGMLNIGGTTTEHGACGTPQYVETMSTGLCGSDPYIAPELFTHPSYSAPRSDVWALGVIYFAMRHLQFPWAVAHEARD